MKVPYTVLCILLGVALGWVPKLLHGPIPEKFDIHYLHGDTLVWAFYTARMLVGFWVGITTWPPQWWLRGPLCGIATMLPPTPENVAAARVLFEKAIALDPKFAGGYAGLALLHTFYVIATRSSTSPQKDIETALRLAQKAISLDDTMAKPFTALAAVYRLQGRYDESIAALQRAIQVEPGYALAYGLLGRYLGEAGRAEEGIEAIRLGLRMSPTEHMLRAHLGATLRLAGQFDEAIDALEHHVRANQGRTTPLLHAPLPAAYMQAGRETEARAAVQALLKNAPKYSLKDVAVIPYKNPKDLETLIDALRKAGLPEG